MRDARFKKSVIQVPEVRLGETATGQPIIKPRHDDIEGWFLVARRAFGTVSDSFVQTQLRFLSRGLRTAMFGESTDEIEMNAALAFISGIQPTSELEAVLATQMALTNVVAMRLLGRTSVTDPTLPHFAPTGVVTAKFLRAFAGQVEALAKLRRPAVQTVRVERVTVEAGGQAVVGLINNRSQPRRGARNSRGDPMERPTNEPASLRSAPRCGARTRAGEPCRKPAIKGKKRCRLHGGAPGSGGPTGDRNGAYRHGQETRTAVEGRRAVSALLRHLKPG
ncbi:HGGxSTG domain-containing protein [Alsobacter sp. KACC 23698]|uniref:HGGxSTG domain-containing protein n=1 Tax=Alsobacter sp. KACC 23698 TaxID=3149229 RepID=A0AAU7JBF4_9HYPH